jgi:peroxiredoxin
MPSIGDPAPQFSAVDVISGQTYNLADYTGQVVLLIFSGPSWCPPCKFEAPVLQDLWEHFRLSVAQPKVQFLLVSCFGNETPEAFKTAVQVFGLTFPGLLNPNETISTLYGVEAVPTLFVINAKQTICDMHQGASPPATALHEEIYKILIGCGAAEPKLLEIYAQLWPTLIPIPDPDPWRAFVRLSDDQKQVLLQFAISELAKGVKDFETARALEAIALKDAEAAMRRIVARSALGPKKLDRPFSERPKGR